MQSVNNPHDKYFQSAMSNKKVAMDFFDAHLPKEFREVIELETMELKNDSYIDKELKQLMSDILYSVNIDGDSGYLYLLVEHQSKADRMMPFRLLEYTCRIMRRDINNGEKTLPIVIPLVLYNGKVKYPYDQDIFSLYADEKQITLAKKCLCQPFNLIDLTKIPDKELMSENWSNIMMLLMKHIYSRDLLNMIESIKDCLKALYEGAGHEYVYTSLKYVLAAGDMDNIDDLTDILNSINTEMGGEVMSIAEKLYAEGREKGMRQGMSQGINKGISQGINKGVSQGIHETAKNFLAEGVDPKIASRATGLFLEEIAKLTEPDKITD